MSDFEIKSAVRVNTPAFVALAGPSGSGKTRSALELATGLAGDDGKILLADTEGNRGLHYADLYKFDHVEFRPNYTPERCAELIDLAEKHGYAVLVLDSASDEYEGEGGLQEIRDQTNDEFWAKTKARHKHALINRIRRSRIHVIFCLRCEERVKIEKVQGRTVIVPLGWMPICEKRFLYEMQSSFRLDPDHPGVPVPIKLYDIHAQFFPPDRPITRDAGRALAAWAAGAPVLAAQKPADDALTDTANKVADQGSHAFRLWWRTLIKGDRDQLRGQLARLQMRAVEADQAASADGPPKDRRASSDYESHSPVPHEASADTPPSGAGAVASLGTVPASSISAPVREAPETGREGPILAGRTPPPVDEPVADAAEAGGCPATDPLPAVPASSLPPQYGDEPIRKLKQEQFDRDVADLETRLDPPTAGGEAAAKKILDITAQSREAVPDAPQGNTAPAAEPPTSRELEYRLVEAASKGVKHFDNYWIHAVTPEERALAAPMCGHYREIAQKAGG